MIRLGPNEQPMIEAFLTEHLDTSMFPRSNLQEYWMNGGHTRAMAFWRDTNVGPITDLLGITDEGMVMPHLRSILDKDIMATLNGRTVIGIIGEQTSCRRAQRALGLTNSDLHLDKDETLFAMNLSNLSSVNTDLSIRSFIEFLRDVLVGWMHDYLTETLGTLGDDAFPMAVQRYNDFAGKCSHVVLVDADTPVAMTGFNAQVGQTVQIGGYARTAIELHLAQAKKSGAKRALLFADDPAAIKAYRSVGFSDIGKFTLCIFSKPMGISNV
ncbi:MAG: GNAT family N-acetyltransferase [Rhodobacterales bacterium]